MLQKLSKGLNHIENIFAIIGAILIAISVFTVVMEVVARALFNYSFIWVNELSEYILLYIPFLGAAWLLRTNGHITVDILEEKMSTHLRYLSDIFISIIGIVICVVFIWYGSLTTLDVFVRDIRSLTTIRVPQIYVIIIIPIGTFILLLEFIRKLHQTIKKTEINHEH